jgi:DNA helicase II / ATP-dependent DNA helicase PcrA
MVVKQRFKRLFNWVKKLRFVNLLEMYKRIFMLENNTPKWNEISMFSVKSLNDMNMTYEDATPFVYLQDLILGKNSDTAIRHVFIDEAQDYSPFQFSFIQQLFPFSKMTLLGDINQAIYSGVTNSKTVLEGLVSRENETESIILTKTYRSTKPIVEFTKGFIENGEKIEAFNRPGKKPTLKIISDFWELEKNLIIKVNSLQENGYKTIAIICKTAKESKMAFDSLKNEMTVRLIEKGTLAYEEGTLIIPAYLAKGIEFDAVIIFDTSQYSRDEERKLFYTACTRAMHELHLFSIETRSPLLKLIPEDTFEIL